MITKFNEYIKEGIFLNKDNKLTIYFIEKWLKNNHIKNYTINPDLTVDVHDFVNFQSGYIGTIPIKFGVNTSYNFHLTL